LDKLALLLNFMTKNLQEYLKLADSKSVDVLLWVLDNRTNDNRLYSTLDSIAVSCNVTKVTVSKLFQKLYKAEFIYKIRNGQYQLINIDGIL
jgi:DNA-binding IscR family transcriptional regulator